MSVCAELESEFLQDTFVCVYIYICMFNPPLLSGQLKSDMVKEVAYTRRKQHQASLQYYCALNALQYRKRVAMLEPMLGYTQAQVLSSCGPDHIIMPVLKFRIQKWEVASSYELI